jgi:hypothetical protein
MMQQFLSFTLVRTCCPLLLFHPFVDGSFKLCNIGLCTSSNVEAGFNYPISKKKSNYSYLPRIRGGPKNKKMRQATFIKIEVGLGQWEH